MARTCDPYARDGAGTATLELLEEARRYNGWLVSHIAPHLGESNLELGAGRGTLTALVAEHFRVVASEPSATGRGELTRRFAGNENVTAIVPSLEALDAGQRFDAVYSANVLEHVEDDVGLIRQAARFLKPRGRFVAIVPAGEWLYSRFDAAVGHLRRYTLADWGRLQQRLAEAEPALSLTTFRHFNPIGAAAWWLRMRLLGRRAIARGDVLVLERLVPLLRHLDALSLPFGQNLLLVARVA